MGTRINGEDTVDNLTHFLHRLQADGWGIVTMDHKIRYDKVTQKGRKIPTSAKIVVELIPMSGD